MPVRDGEFYSASNDYDARSAYIIERGRFVCSMSFFDARIHAGDDTDNLPIDQEPDADHAHAYRCAAEEFDNCPFIQLILRNFPLTLYEAEIINTVLELAFCRNVDEPLDVPGMPAATGRRIVATELATGGFPGSPDEGRDDGEDPRGDTEAREDGGGGGGRSDGRDTAHA